MPAGKRLALNYSEAGISFLPHRDDVYTNQWKYGTEQWTGLLLHAKLNSEGLWIRGFQKV